MSTDSETTQYVLIVTSTEARSGVKGNPIVTHDGDRYIVANDSGGWVDATSEPFTGAIPTNAKLFPSAEEAAAFLQRWKPHPWYCVPSGHYEIVKVRPKYRQVLAGFERLDG